MSRDQSAVNKLQFVFSGDGGGGGGVFTCPYPLKVQARPPQDQRLAFRSRVSGQEEVLSVLLYSVFIACCRKVRINIDIMSIDSSLLSVFYY